VFTSFDRPADTSRVSAEESAGRCKYFDFYSLNSVNTIHYFYLIIENELKMFPCIAKRALHLRMIKYWYFMWSFWFKIREIFSFIMKFNLTLKYFQESLNIRRFLFQVTFSFWNVKYILDYDETYSSRHFYPLNVQPLSKKH